MPAGERVNLAHKGVLVPLAIFSALTVLLFFLTPTPSAHLEIDSCGYERLGTHFASTGHLVDPLNPTHHPIQTLAYPFFLGVIYKIFGHSYAWVVVMQWLLALLCGAMIFRTTRRLADRTTANIALFLWAVNLGFLVYVQFLLTEILLVTFLLAFVDRFVVFLDTKKLNTLAISCFFLGCSVVVKPAALFFIAPLMVLVMCGRYRSSKALSRGIIALLAFSVPLLTYMTSNKIRFGHFAIAPMSNEILYRYFAAKIKAKLEHKKYEEVLVSEQWCADEDLLSENAWQASKKFMLQTTREHPGMVIGLWLTNVLKTWLGLFTTQLKVLLDPSVKGGDCSFFKMAGTGWCSCACAYITFGNIPALRVVALLEAVWMLVRYLLVLCALLWLVWTKKYFTAIFFAAYLAYFTLVTGHDGCCRYRMMIEPVLIIMTAYGIRVFLKICGMLRPSN